MRARLIRNTKDPSGGEIYYNCWILIKDWHQLLFMMVTLAISGTTIGEAKSPSITFQQATEAVHQLHTLFHLPLSELTFERWLELQTIMAQFTLNDSPDQWVCIWRSLFSCSKTYRSIIDHADTKKKKFSWLWKYSCRPKDMVFFWLLLKDQLSTRNLLKYRVTVLWLRSLRCWY